MSGGGSSGGGSSTTNTTSTPWVGLQPYLKTGLEQTAQGFGLNGDGTTPANFSGLNQDFIGKPYTGNTVAADSPYTTQALNTEAARAQAGSPYLASGDNMLNDVLSGKYLTPDSNPYIKATYDQAAKSVTDNYNNVVNPGIDSQASSNGRYGSGAYAQARNQSDTTLGHDLNDLATNIYGTNYQNERNLQTGALTTIGAQQSADYYDANQLAGIGDYYTNLGQQNLDASINQYNQQQQLPLSTLQAYNNIINGYPNPTSTTSTATQRAAAQKAGGASGALSGAASGASAGAMFGPWGAAIGGVGGALIGGFSKSDIHLKENIEPLGKESGFNIYKFNYKGSPLKYIGIMAQDIVDTHPEAVRVGDDGYLEVNYDAIGVQFRRAS